MRSFDECKTAWKGTTQTRKKHWGVEISAGGIHHVQTKILYINKGMSTSLKYYPNKNEVLFVRDGSVEITYASENYIKYPRSEKLNIIKLDAGSVFYIQSGCPYSIKAITACEIFEIGDNSLGCSIKINLDTE